MKYFHLKAITALAVVTIVWTLLGITKVQAMLPTLSLSNTTYGLVQVTVYGDPNAAVVFDYYSGNQLLGAGIIGYTNYSGYFSGQINTSSFPIPSGARVLVMVNDQQSYASIWPTSSYYPYGYNYGGITPTLSLGNNGYNLNQITVYGDPNAAVVLDYYAGNQLFGAGIVGYTNSSGYFSAQLNPGWYGIPNGAPVVVMVNGRQSNQVTWYLNNVFYTPGPVTSYQYPAWLSVNNSNVQLTVGNVGTVTVYGGTNLYIPNAYNNGVASGVLSGTTVTIYGIAPGSTTLRVCQSNTGQCVPISVTVINPYNYYNNSQYYYPPSRNGDWYYSYNDHRWHHR